MLGLSFDSKAAAESIFPIMAVLIIAGFWWFRHHRRTGEVVRSVIDEAVTMPALQINDLLEVLRHSQGLARRSHPVLRQEKPNWNQCVRLTTQTEAIPRVDIIYCVIDTRKICLEEIYISSEGKAGITLRLSDDILLECRRHGSQKFEYCPTLSPRERDTLSKFLDRLRRIATAPNAELAA